MLLSRLPIKSLYPLALAEGEGVGTAYEYYAKRLVLAGWLGNIRTAQGQEPGHLVVDEALEQPGAVRLLIAGLPEKYGASLDFLLLASELHANLTVIDDRSEALEKGRSALTAVQSEGMLADVEPAFVLTRDLTALPELDGPFDLCLSSEVLQRLPAERRPAYWRRLWGLAPGVALFAPNGDNPAHATLSGLASLRLDEMRSLAQDAPGARVGYIDMPPFPPGLTRSSEQRTQASTGLVEGIAMWGLGLYARMESLFPIRLRRKQSHIVYALAHRQ